MKSADQFMTHTWPSRAAALKELKRSGLKEGADYVLSETSPNSDVWHIADKAPDGGDTDNVVPIKRKAARKGPAKAEPEPKPEPEPEPEPKAAEPQTVETNDMSPMPTEGGPYSLGAADALAQHSIAELALSWSIKTGERIAIHAKGKTVRIIDGRIGKPVRTGGGRGPRSTGKSADVVKLLMREHGATKEELLAITEWQFGERYIKRLAATYKADIKVIAKDHWRLIKHSD